MYVHGMYFDEVAYANQQQCGCILHLGLGEEEQCGNVAVAVVIDEGTKHEDYICEEHLKDCHPTRYRLFVPEAHGGR